LHCLRETTKLCIVRQGTGEDRQQGRAIVAEMFLFIIKDNCIKAINTVYNTIKNDHDHAVICSGMEQANMMVYNGMMASGVGGARAAGDEYAGHPLIHARSAAACRARR
jgi:hypothetical protein